MFRSAATRLPQGIRGLRPTSGLQCLRCYSQESGSPVRHLMSIQDLTPKEFETLVRSAAKHKKAVKSGNVTEELSKALKGDTVAMMFSKRSTRTRVSTEAAVARMGGHPMFLGSNDIQLGVNESLLDTSKIISSMTSCMVARVGPHSDVTGLAEHSSVPVINALSDDFHPLQTIADYLTIFEVFPGSSGLVPSNLKIAWVGDSNNVLFDLAIASAKLGVHIAVASPAGYEIPKAMEDIILSAAETSSTPGKLTTTQVPAEAIKDADIIVTDTWVSMGQEADKVKRLKDFEGYQLTQDMINGAGAKSHWKFMHCLPRHPEEVHDDVFYSPQSLVFQEGENRLWAAIAALEAFVVKKGNIV